MRSSDGRGNRRRGRGTSGRTELGTQTLAPARLSVSFELMMEIDHSKYPGLHPLPPHFVKDFPPVAKVVEEKCIACDRCPPLCFFDAIVMEDRREHKFKRTAVVVPENCTGCGLCFEACPVDAFLWVPDKTSVDKPPRSATETERDLSA